MKTLFLSAGLILATGPTARALINVKFTPVDLVEKAGLVLALRVCLPDDKDRCAAQITKCLKGRSPDKASVIELGKSKAENTWEVDTINGGIESTWAGGTDMLIKLCELLVKHPDTGVLVASGVNWGEPVSLGKVAGKVSLAQAADIAGKRGNGLFPASDAGDRLFQWDRQGNKLADLSAKCKLGPTQARFSLRSGVYVVEMPDPCGYNAFVGYGPLAARRGISSEPTQ